MTLTHRSKKSMINPIQEQKQHSDGNYSTLTRAVNMIELIAQLERTGWRLLQIISFLLVGALIVTRQDIIPFCSRPAEHALPVEPSTVNSFLCWIPVSFHITILCWLMLYVMIHVFILKNDSITGGVCALLLRMKTCEKSSLVSLVKSEDPPGSQQDPYQGL